MRGRKMKFEMEIKEVKSKKTISNDMEYSIRLTTGDHNLLSLGAIPPNQTVLVEFKTSSPETWKEEKSGERKFNLIYTLLPEWGNQQKEVLPWKATRKGSLLIDRTYWLWYIHRGRLPKYYDWIFGKFRRYSFSSLYLHPASK